MFAGASNKNNGMRKNVETLNSVSASLRISVCPKQQVVPLRYASKIALRLRKQSTFYDEFILALPEDLTCTMERALTGGVSQVMELVPQDPLFSRRDRDHFDFHQQLHH